MAGRVEELSAVGSTVRQTRAQRDMSAGELAVAASIDRGRLDAIEGGRLYPAHDVLLALADGLGVESATLLSSAGSTADLDPDTASVAFGLRLRKLRTEHRISQDDLAHRTGIHSTAIARLEDP
jgi:transcriptional regulator with XRE-family HTH domain